MIKTLIAVLAISLVTIAAKPPSVECWLDRTETTLTFTATNLKLNELYGVGGFPPPNGGISPDENGTIVREVAYHFTEVTLWSRGGGGALYKPGKQLNDYHPICIATENL